MFSLPKKLNKKLALIGQVAQEKKMFENNGHIHVFCPVAGVDMPPGSFFKIII